MCLLTTHGSLLLLLGALTATGLIAFTDSASDLSSTCQQQKSCAACIVTSPGCHWCSDETIVGVFERCDVPSKLDANGCRQKLGPQSEIKYDRNETFRNADVAAKKEAIQLAPQQVTIRLRTKAKFTIPVIFRQAKDYPVDIYFIMDLSNTMRVYANTLVNVAEDMAEAIKQITTDIRFGFGSFVDKPTLPFADKTHISSISNTTVPAYNFRNQLKLTHDVLAFKEKVAHANFSSNVDDPEAGLDAIMQALTCKEQIGWRDNARKLVLLFTDDIFHSAGDGKLGGVLLPNDEQCHLDEAGYYSEALNRDYPSISQVATQVALNKVSLIFAVTEEHSALYKRLSSHIPGSATGLLTADTTGLINIVKDNYKSISSSIELKTEAKTEADREIVYSYQTVCPNGVSSTSTAPKCSDIKIGQNVEFRLEVQIDSCPTSPTSRRTLEISPIGLSDKLIVNVEVICDCDCVKETESSKCSGSGTRECGICTCDSGSFGDNCECGSPDLCLRSRSSEPCDGHGTCECARCNCSTINQYSDKRYTGRFCECNNYNCDYYNNELCGGPSHGTCECSQCICRPGYSGANCGCLSDDTKCKDGTGAICGNRGVCICGEFCQCEEDYSGPTCNNCPSCKEKCEESYKPCAQCHLLNQASSSEEACSLNCSRVTGTALLVDKIPDCGTDCLTCRYTDESDLCEASFVYIFKSLTLEVQKTKENCPTPISTTIIIAVVVGVIIAIGIILLIVWKVIVTVHDQREYQAFLAETANMKFAMVDNRLYKGATTTFQNPSFGNKKMA